MKEKILALLEQKKYPEIAALVKDMNPADAAVLLEELPQQSMPLIFRLLPKELAATGEAYLTGAVLSDAERRLLKAADRLSALIKCMEECQSGNREFEAALAQQRQALADMHCPEADYFMQHMLPCYSQNLDELTRGRF